MPRFHNINGNKVQFTQAEETVRDAEEEQAVINRQARRDAEVVRQANIASTKAKLEALGLTVDEIRDTFGLSS